MTLVQTSVVATKGYAIVALEQQRTELMRERGQLQLRYAEAQSLDTIRERARAIGMRPRTRDQIRYVTVIPIRELMIQALVDAQQEASP